MAVIAVAEGLLKAIGTRDSAAARRLLLPGARLVSIGAGANARPRYQADTSFLNQIVTSPQRLMERMWSPTVTLHGPLAQVQAPYDFHIDGKFSHCGVDVFTLMRTTSGWRIVGLAWTTQPTGCEPSPLGPPAGTP